jgi:hypothetical protein
MKISPRVRKILFPAICLTFLYLLSYYETANHCSFRFYDKWIEYIFVRSQFTVTFLLWIWLIWQLTNGIAKFTILKWFSVVILALPALFGFWILYFMGISLSKGHPLDDGVDVLYRRPGPGNTIILSEYVHEPSLIADIYAITLQQPVIKDFLFISWTLWSDKRAPSEKELQAKLEEVGANL